MLNTRDLSVARGSIRLLEGLNLDLAAGQALALRGPNGLGKTTLLRTLAGLQPPLSGAVEADPETLVYAGHADGIKLTLSVKENLKFWALVFGRTDISAALRAFDLEGLGNRQAGQLSAGQKRRLGLARLIVTGRALWLLDEPTVSLDSDAVAMFAAAVAAHLARGGAAVIATHIELGLDRAEVLELTPFRARPARLDEFDEAFL